MSGTSNHIPDIALGTYIDVLVSFTGTQQNEELLVLQVLTRSVSAVTEQLVTNEEIYRPNAAC